MKKGFTLIELIIVIGILAILATVVVLVLNPAQMLAQARDSARISDLSSIKSAVGLWLATATTTTVGTESRSNATTTCWFSTCSATCTLNATTTVDGNGWVALDLRGTTGGSPLSSLPLDPSHPHTTFQYAYKGGGDTAKTFELNANLESERHLPLEGTDGGNCSAIYEVGTDPGLDL